MDDDLAAIVRILKEMDTVTVDHYQSDGTAFVFIHGMATVSADDARVLERLVKR